ncbi:hypothetical protein M0811_09992 [Anaeramoeba ignava]|uniref:Uncharacterized protein n=1 Tax=Anaeramoeba ignava TaxID=1746090 RepID=A0A9Q0R981_ANAIG|nr:hypothetical protein M0811_09992 [Anaeramoeba ignava]|eukprot:Anaeramoba_ignava/a480934_7.p1 GENE.a480934_7~~a480934_7.p1  ORF type:complete len:279 (-),score=81.38 a480934_7:103-939(-)
MKSCSIYRKIGIIGTEEFTTKSKEGIIQFIAKPNSQNIIYYEAKISENSPKDGIIGIGFAPKGYSDRDMVGWKSQSVGYHSDDGGLFNSSGNPTLNLETYKKGDSVGCLFDLNKNLIQFTKNGNLIKESIVYRDNHLLIPTVSGSDKAVFYVNFDGPFSYDFQVSENSNQSINSDMSKDENVRKLLDSKIFSLKSDQISQLSVTLLQELEAEFSRSLQLIQNEISRKNSDLCVVCFDKSKTVVFLPCRHCCCCDSCSMLVTNCPLCRAKINDRMKIFV